MSHTPTPWAVERTIEIGVDDGPVEVFEIAEEAEPYADFNVIGYTYSVEHAELIVKAVNSYQAMKEALEAVVQWDDLSLIEDEWPIVMSQVKQALALTNGKDKEP